MGTINVTTEPTEVTVNGTTFHLQGDPSATPEWDTLLETEMFYTGDKAKISRAELVEALAGLAVSPEDAETIRGLPDGNKTLWNMAMAYIREVTGFPTQPPASSTPRSKKTGGTSAPASR
jgi:hypothetical protein